MIPRERISFEQLIEYQDGSGEMIREYKPLLSDIPAERRKQQVSKGDNIQAEKEFIEKTIVFWIRFHPLVTSRLRIIFQGDPYLITDLNRRFHDNSYLITCEKISI